MVCGNPGRAAVIVVGLEQTAAHLVDLVFPQVPVRQWVLSLPKRLRYFHHHQTRLVNTVLRIVLAEVGAAVRSCSPDTPSGERFGVVAFVHRVKPHSGVVQIPSDSDTRDSDVAAGDYRILR